MVKRQKLFARSPFYPKLFAIRQFGILMRACLCDAALYALAGAVFRKLFGAANRVAYGARVRAAVPDQHDLTHAQQRRSSVLRVIQTLFDITESGPGQHSTGLGL